MSEPRAKARRRAADMTSGAAGSESSVPGADPGALLRPAGPLEGLLGQAGRHRRPDRRDPAPAPGPYRVLLLQLETNQGLHPRPLPPRLLPRRALPLRPGSRVWRGAHLRGGAGAGTHHPRRHLSGQPVPAFRGRICRGPVRVLPPARPGHAGPPLRVRATEVHNDLPFIHIDMSKQALGWDGHCPSEASNTCLIADTSADAGQCPPYGSSCMRPALMRPGSAGPDRRRSPRY